MATKSSAALPKINDPGETVGATADQKIGAPRVVQVQTC